MPKTEVNQQHKFFESLTLADPFFGRPAAIDALFGMCIWIRIVEPGLMRSPDNTTVAQSTKIGHIIYQVPIQEDQTPQRASMFLTQHQPLQLDQVTEQLQRFWEIEQIPKASKLSAAEEQCERIFVNTHFRRSDGRYVVELPFNSRLQSLGRSKSRALQHFFTIERKMDRNPDYGRDYREYMQNFEKDGLMSRITDHVEDGYYTPHHGVYGAAKTKIRIVYNSSFPTTTGTSLNDCQYTGAKLQQNLAITLMQFRIHHIALQADIKQMYCQVEVADHHKKYQKILWRASPSEPVGVYQLNRVAFGQTAAPFLAIRAMHQCARDYTEQYPIGATEVLNSFYVDDLLTGADTRERALEVHHQVSSLLQQGKFMLTKWCSNDGQINNTINGQPATVELDDPDMRSVLGLRWSPIDDTFSYTYRSHTQPATWTKRKILSEIGKLYDPNGFIAPVIIIAKIFIQHLWKSQLEWDEPVTFELQGQWASFQQQIIAIQDITIPRWIGTRPSLACELHGFSDASVEAYGCAVYVKTTQPNGITTINLLQSKTRVAPLKTISIPRLELCGAELLAELLKVILPSFNQFPNTRIHCWTDSEVVLHWLNKCPSTLKTFVANRVSSINHETTRIGAQWHWTPGKDNPADIASRGMYPESLKLSSLWWNGPEWLINDENLWPEQPILANSKEADAECKPPTAAVHFTQAAITSITRGGVPILDVYGKYTRLIRVLAYVQRAINNWRARISPINYTTKVDSLSAEELDNATILAVRLDQQTHMQAELREARKTSKENRKRTFFIDPKTDVLRLFGRVASPNLTFDEQFPIMVSTTGALAKLLLRHIHSKTIHGGAQHMLQVLRQQFWIVRARHIAARIIHSCQPCFRERMKVSEQLMASLPRQRTTPGRPFKISGVDYIGPVDIATRAGRHPAIVKGYISLFICFVTRAIHLELVNDQSAVEFLQALRRFIARRGEVHEMWSDNGTNFVGANNMLRNIAERNAKLGIEGRTAEFKMKWRFIIPQAPSWGGLWEAGVKSVKRHLIRAIGPHKLTFTEYATLLTQVEAAVNSRPLTPISDDPSDLTALTPAHFLIGESLTTLPDARDYTDVRPGILKRWELLQQMYQSIWTRWHTEYIDSLKPRSKWQQEHRNIAVNDLVVVKEDNIAPANWELARVIEVYHSPDKLVRAALVQTKTAKLRRPITKLGLLIAHDDQPSG